MGLKRKPKKTRLTGLIPAKEVNINFRPLTTKGQKTVTKENNAITPLKTDSERDTSTQNSNNVPAMEVEQVATASTLPLFQTVVNKNKRANKDANKDNSNVKMPRVSTSNKYDPLIGLPVDGGSSNNGQPAAQPPPSGKRPSPIIIDGKPVDFARLRTLLTEHCEQKFTIKFGPKTTAIHVESNSDKKRVFDALKSNQTNYWTYTNRDERSHAFVLYGLDCEVDLGELETEIKSKLPSVSRIYKINTQYRPLYLIITDNKTKLQDVQKSIKSVCYCKVTFKMHMNKK